MKTKQDVVDAAIKFGLAYFEYGLYSDTELAIEKNEAQEEAYEHFKKVLDEFEKTLLNKEAKND